MRVAARAAALLLAAAACAGMGDGAHILAVYPSGESVPANLLRVSIAFDRSPGVAVLPRLSLAGVRLAPGEPPFLDQELWAPDGRTLTVLLDPARVKTGLLASERFGRVLQQGEDVTLRLDGRAIKRWRVSAPRGEGPHPGRWRINPPRPGSRNPVVLELDGPIDAFDQGLITVALPEGRPVAGAVTLWSDERRWSLTPEAPWQPSRYQVLVSPALEDAAGNAVAQSFEFKGQPVPADRAPPVSVPFVVR